MAAPSILLLLVAVVTTCNCDLANNYSPNSGNTASQFGTILKPPPPPHLSPIVPVPFHGGAPSPTLDKTQLQNLENLDAGYHYQLPPPLYPPPIKLSNDFKFPAPFYKQYAFNFVPPPQPFSTTPSPSLFQKVSGWLFPSQQTSYAGSTVFNNNLAPIKKDCNPCNLVPWLPVMRYNVGNRNVYQSSLPTYVQHSPTAYADFLKVVQQHPEPFQIQNDERRLPQLSPSLPHKTYGPPSYNTGPIRIASSTYGPPSATHALDVSSQNPSSSTFSQSSTSYAVPSSSYGLPSSPINNPSITHNQPVLSLSQPSLQLKQPNSPFNQPSLSHNQYSSSYISTPVHGVSSIISNIVGSTYSPISSSYGTPSQSYGTSYPVTTTFQPVIPHYDPGVLNKDLPQDNDVEILNDVDPIRELELPKVSHPTSFKNSYGEPISNPNIFDIPFAASATGAESSKIKTQVLPYGVAKQPNVSFALANPAPFTMNRGRNIHTLQPVALPNLSVSPLPPIFNARPFRPVGPHFSTNVLQGIKQQPGTNVNVEQSISLAEFTHSVDYPATVIQSPVIDIDATGNFNHSKAYRFIPNSYITDDIRDISSQASEDHISATKSVPDSSFESTGKEVDNDLYDTGAPSDFRPIAQVPPNHKLGFADLRGVKEEDVDKYRTENNLQNIDSPLLYLKPSAPHKKYGNFVLAVSSPIPDNEYEIYDDVPTTGSPQAQTHAISWDESRSDYNDDLSTPPAQQSVYQPKIVQIIVPYTTENKPETFNMNDFVQMQVDAISKSKEDYQPRKVPSNTDNSYVSTVTENYSTISTTTEETLPTITEHYDSDRLSSSGNKDHYDVKEPPFDIIKLQHNIDDWTEQEYSKQYKTPQRTRSSEKYAKNIPDEYFTTTVPTNYVTSTNNYNYDFYDHEVSSSIQHSVTDEVNNASNKPRKEYNVIERIKNRPTSGKNEELKEAQRLHIYTAASSFRATTTTTPAPWGKIQTSISPLTKEKVYVVTSKPWRGNRNVSNDWYNVDAFESKKTNIDHESSVSKNLPFKSPRFITRPSFGFSSGGKVESVKSDSLYGFSRSWYQSINELESQAASNTTFFPGDTHRNDTTNLDEDTAAATSE